MRFYLRPQARFSDGTPVTAEDVVFTFETLVSKGDPMYRNYYADVDKVVAGKKLRVRFDFKRRQPRTAADPRADRDPAKLLVGRPRLFPRPAESR